MAASEDEELSDTEIQRLLKEAEARLRAATDLKTQETTIQIRKREGNEHKVRPQPEFGSQLKRSKPYIRDDNGIARTDPKLLVNKDHRKLADSMRTVKSLDNPRPKNDKPTAGPEWFDLPKTIPDAQFKRDLQIIEMRNVLDPHRHYKKDNRKGKVPAFSQMGTVVDGKIKKKGRSKNIVEEVFRERG